MGTGDYSPMAINYIPVENSTTAIDVLALPCSESYDVSAMIYRLLFIAKQMKRLYGIENG